MDSETADCLTQSGVNKCAARVNTKTFILVHIIREIGVFHEPPKTSDPQIREFTIKFLFQSVELHTAHNRVHRLYAVYSRIFFFLRGWCISIYFSFSFSHRLSVEQLKHKSWNAEIRIM